MKKIACKNVKNEAWPIIFLCWLVYMSSYIGKVSYSANITQVIDFYKITKTEAGMVPSFFFFAYGIGQVINGYYCKKYNIKWMIFFSLVVSATINFLIAVGSNFAMIKWLWMINGFVLSILWPTLVRLLSEKLSRKDLGRSSVIMGTTVAIGTLIIYGLSSIYVAFDKFKFAFYTAAFTGVVVAILWILLYKKVVVMAKNERIEQDFIKEKKDFAQEEVQERIREKKIFFASIYILCFCAIGVNLIKDGLTTWVPSILKEEYFMTDSISILLTLLLPIVAIFGNIFALSVHKKTPDYVTHCFVVFVAISGFIAVIIGSLALKQVVFMLVGLVAVSFLASSLNSLITSIFPIFMRGKINSGLYAGILNGFCYLGSTISSHGLGFVAESFGWVSVFWVLIGFCFIVGAVWCGYSYLKHDYFHQRKSRLTRL